MGRPYLRPKKNCRKAKHRVVHTINKDVMSLPVNGSRVILLDSALQLKLEPTLICQNPKSDFPETVRELNDHISLIKTYNNPKKNQKVNFVDFIDRSKTKTENNNDDAKQEFEEINVKQEFSEESSTESKQNTDSSLVLVEDRFIKTSDNKIVKITKQILNLKPGTIKKVPFVPIRPKITTLDQINLERENRYKILLPKKVQVTAQALQFTEFTAAQSKPSVVCGNISKVLNEQKLFNHKIPSNRVIELHPFEHTFKSSEDNKKRQLSSVLKTVIKNNLTIQLQQKNSKEAFPVALKSSDHEDIKLLDLNPTNETSGEQILGI